MAAVLQLAEGAAPATPGAGYHNLYFDTSGVAHTLSDAGVDVSLATTAIQLVTANITDKNITNAKLADVATATIKGRATAGTGVPEDLTAAEVATIVRTVLDGVYATGGGNTDPTWTDLTLTSGWSATLTYPDTLRASVTTTFVPTLYRLQYRMVGGVVFVRGGAAAVSASNYSAGVLPAGYRPPYTLLVPGWYESSSTVDPVSILWSIHTDGNIYKTSNTSTASGWNYHITPCSFVPA